MAEEAELIGRRMAERRKELDLTQREVAERMPGSTQAADVSRWERGKHRPEPMPQIAEALETTIADLVSGPLAERKQPAETNDLLDQLSEKTADATEPAILAALSELGDQVAALRAELLAELGVVRKVQEDQLAQQAPAERRRAAKQN